MESKSLELDPSGDINLVLLQPNSQKLRWSTDAPAAEDGYAEDSEDVLNPEATLDIEPTLNPGSDVQSKPEEESNELKMLVSSSHLCLASSTFRKMLRGPWREARSDGDAIREIQTTEWDVEALLVVLNIIHGHHRFVPKSVSLELLAKIATIVDYYKCHEITAVFVDRWLLGLEGNLPSSYGKDCVLWLSISWVFLRVDILQKMAEVAIMGCEGPVETMDLPFPNALLSKGINYSFRHTADDQSQTSLTGLIDIIEDKRRQSIEQIIMMLYSLRDSLCSETGCSEKCSATLLGFLMRHMDAAGIAKVRAKDAFEVFDGRSIELWINAISGFSSSYYMEHCYECNSCGCTLEERIRPALDEKRRFVRDLKLESVWSQRMKEQELHQG